jgi:hypothetical protein
MNKLLTCTAAALVLLLGAQTSFADHNDRWDRHDRHDRYDRHDNGRGWGRHDRRDRHDHDHVSVSLSFGTVFGGAGYNDWRYRDYRRATSGFGVPYTTAWGAPGWGYNNRPVIVHQNTYVNTAPRTRVVTRPGRNSTSLFRDINGRCFERYIDSRGNETRTELSASECNF